MVRITLTLSPRGCQLRATAGGGYLIPPKEIPEGVVLDPMLYFFSWIYLKLEPTCKELDINHRNCHNSLKF